MVNYNIADLVSRINNSYRTGKNHIILPYSKDSYQIIILLTKLGILNINSPERALLAGSSPALDPDEAVIWAANMQPSPSPPFARRALRGRGQIYITSSLDLKKSSTLKPFLQLISKPGKRIYIGYKNLKDFNNGYKLYILRTSKGIISSQTAIKYKIGGELLMKVLI